ncbi:MAG: hypothetical protein ACERKV_03330 [Clostridiaceae bacterium]
MKFKNKAKLEDGLAYLFRLLFLIAAVLSFGKGNYLNFFTAVFSLFITYLPDIIAKKNKIKLPPSFQIIILIFIFSAQYLGELRNYYIIFPWWDTMLHTLSGIILGFTGFLLVYILNKDEGVNLNMTPIFVAIFSFTFAVAVGALWEIFEFFMDSTFGLNMQKSGLIDTMGDLIVDTLGALFTSVVGFYYLKRGQETYFSKLLRVFFKFNPVYKKKNRDIGM